MAYTAPEPFSDLTKAPNYRPVENAEQTYGNAGKTTKRRRIYVLQGVSGTLFAMIMPYLLGILGTPLSCFDSVTYIETFQGLCIAAAHFALYTYLDGKRIDIDTALLQSWVSAIALVLVNTFRLAVCFSLGVAFTQLLWRRIRTTSMPLGDFDRLEQLQINLRAMLHPKTLRMVYVLSIVAVLGWLITIAMILPPGSLTVVAKKFNSETEQRVLTFNSSFTGNGTFESASEYMLALVGAWEYE
jgi:hypothetical protein